MNTYQIIMRTGVSFVLVTKKDLDTVLMDTGNNPWMHCDNCYVRTRDIMAILDTTAQTRGNFLNAAPTEQMGRA